MIWDREVDVVCVGGMIGGLATAIVAADAGVEVFVATTSRDQHEDPLSVAACAEYGRGWLAHYAGDAETDEYFAALSSDLEQVTPATDRNVPVRVVQEPSPADQKSRTVEPFRGARLRDWAAQCLASPYGMLYTRISNWQTTTMRGTDGDAVNVKVIGRLGPQHADRAIGLPDWLAEQANDRGIDPVPFTALRRIVFEEGEVVGVVLDTSDGPYAVRARHGITVAPDGADANAGAPLPPVSTWPVQVCLVSHTASRFSRLELLTTEPAPVAPRSTCRAMNRHLHESLRETRHARLQAPRCRKMHRYPPLGQ